MRHAEHFLSRLDRLATAEVDVALQLYRDPDLLRCVLAAVRLPDAAERVAISLADPVEGPFLVVTRDGHFVTCLAKGMKAGSLPIVSRGQLDALADRFTTLRERLALAARLVGSKERACAQLLMRILRSADGVSREDFLAVSAWQPLLAPAFMDMYVGMGAELIEQGPILRRLRGTKGRAEEALHEYWNLIHATGHLALLGTMGGDGEPFRAICDGQPLSGSAFSFGLTSTGVTTFILKGTWAAGRLGKQLLPAYKKALAEDVALFDLFDTLFSLVAIGRRTAALRAEIAKALASAPRVARTPEAIRLREVMGDAVEVTCAFAAEVLDADEEESEGALLRIGKRLLEVPDLPPLDGLPEDVIRAIPLSSYTDGLTDGGKVMTSLALISAAARGAPEQFYLPNEYAKAWRVPWEPAATQHLLAPMVKVEQHLRKPAVRKATPQPNQPCSCGSGRKYKKCCGSPLRSTVPAPSDTMPKGRE